MVRATMYFKWRGWRQNSRLARSTLVWLALLEIGWVGWVDPLHVKKSYVNGLTLVQIMVANGGIWVTSTWTHLTLAWRWVPMGWGWTPPPSLFNLCYIICWIRTFYRSLHLNFSFTPMRRMVCIRRDDSFGWRVWWSVGTCWVKKVNSSSLQLWL